MSRRVKEYIDIRDHVTLDGLIERLIEVRSALPENPEAELRLRGDDIFGRKLSISYLRELTPEEVECEARYTATDEPHRPQQLDGDNEGWRDVA